MIMNPAMIHFYNSSILKFTELDTKLTLNGVKIDLSNFGNRENWLAYYRIG